MENSTLCHKNCVHQYDQYDADDDSVGKLLLLAARYYAVEVECFYIIVARNPRLTFHKEAKNIKKSPFTDNLITFFHEF